LLKADKLGIAHAFGQTTQVALSGELFCERQREVRIEYGEARWSDGAAMSKLTVELVPASKIPSRRRHWQGIFATVADRLMVVYGMPSLGNLRDPVREIFYIVLSARTTDGQYR
jgi:hypothetical protein